MSRDFLHTKKSPYSLSVLSGLLLVFCQPPVSQFYLAYFALTPLLFTVEAGRVRLNFLSGFIAGIVS
ncbi:MAG: hypothetical protein ABSE25_10415, partial [Syntrophorhabdales bacterium]